MREIFIDVENGSNNTIKVTQGDNLTESYKLIITENKIRLDLTNKKVKFAFVKSDSHYGDIIEELKILNAIEGEVEFEVVNRITKVDGLYSCGLAVYDDKGFLEHTGTFSLYVRESIFEKVSGELIKNSAYKELISLLDRATNLNKEIDPIVINAEEKTNTLKENIKVADNSNKTLVDNTEKANTLNNTLVENTNEAKKTNENAVIKDNTLKETIKVAEANNNKLIHTNDSAKEINNTLVENTNEVKEVNENAINIKTSLENNINQATNLKSDLETEINKSVLANSTLIKSIDNATETNKDFINKDSNLKETIKNAENINEELSENENKATLNEATRKKNEAERIEAEKVREEKIEQFGSQVTKNKNDITENTKDIERAFETINDNSFIPFTGENISVEHSKVGFTKDMQIEGMTYQNLLIDRVALANDINVFNHNYNKVSLKQGEGYIEVTSINENNDYALLGYDVHLTQDPNLFKFNTKYLVMADIEILENPTNASFCVGGFVNNIKDKKINSGRGIVAKVMETGSDFNGNNGRISVGSDSMVSKGTKFRYYGGIALELPPDELSNKSIDELINKYWFGKFEGIKSVGEKENKISILSNGKNLFNINGNVNQYYPNMIIGTGGSVNVDNNHITTTYNSAWSMGKGFIIKNALNKKYIITADVVSIGTGTNAILGVYYKDKTYALLGRNKSKIIMTFVSKKDEFLLTFVTEGGKGAKFTNVQVEIAKEGQTTASDFEPYKEDKKEILLPFEGGLKGIGNFKDTIEIREDGVYALERIIKVPYQEGDENLENCITDKVNSYKVIEQAIEHKITDLNSINLETFKDVTYVSSENEIKPNLSFKAPVDIPKTISSLRNANTMLIAQNVGLENKNTELEKVNNQQNKALKELNDTTSFLIEDSLSK